MNKTLLINNVFTFLLFFPKITNPKPAPHLLRRKRTGFKKAKTKASKLSSFPAC